MATSESEYIQKTITQLGALIKKPPLTDKYLSKPPFRFLHDVILAVIKQTGFLEGLYQGEELDGKETNESKDKKIAFLQKAIDAVQMTNGESLSVKPGKIVAGQEADRTNEFLQALAQAAKKGPNADVVARVLKGEKPFSASGDSGGSAGSNKENRSDSSKKKDDKEKSKETKKEAKKESKERSPSKERKSKDGSKEKTNEEAKSKSEKKEKETDKTKEKDKAKEKPRSSSKTREDEKRKKEEGDQKKSSKSATTRRPSIDKLDAGDQKQRSSKSAKSDGKKSDEKSEEKPKRRQSSAAAKLGEEKEKKRSSSSKKESEKEKHKEPESAGMRIDLSPGNKPEGGEIVEVDHEMINGEEDRPKASANALNDNQAALKVGGNIIRSGAARPSSAAGVRPGTASGARPGTAARAAPPRLKRQELGAVIADETATAAEVAQNAPVIAPVLIQSDIKKGGLQNDDDDEDFIVENRESSGIDNLIINDDGGTDGVDLETESGDHGQLVRKILETKKELESQLKTGASAAEKTVVVFDAQEREKTKKETGKLQEVVQQLTRTSHPLAKIVDFLQEDVDSMLKELQVWRQDAKKDADLLRQETGTRTASGVDSETLKNKLNELDQQINEQSEAIITVRGLILNNEQRIQKIMSAIAKK